MKFAPLILGVVLLLGGCANLIKQNKADLAWEARRARLEQLDRFTLQARVSSGLMYRGNLNWRQRPDDFDLHVSGPFGVGAISISGSLDNVQIRTRSNTYVTPDPEGFLHDKLGWTFPVSHLRYWALGLPAPSSDAEVELDEKGRVLSLHQDHWTLEYDEYQLAATGLELPRRFVVGNAEVTIKVVVDTWSDLTSKK